MTRKDYERLATAFQGALRDAEGSEAKEYGVAMAVHAVALALAEDNGAFDRDRFVRACMPGANVRARG